jgi:hypothetical protein
MEQSSQTFFLDQSFNHVPAIPNSVCVATRIWILVGVMDSVSALGMTMYGASAALIPPGEVQTVSNYAMRE